MNIFAIAAGLAGLALCVWWWVRWSGRRRALRKPPARTGIGLQPIDALTPSGESTDEPSYEPLSVAALRRLAPFENLSEEELIAFAAERRLESHPPGAVLFDAGDSPETVFFLISGQIVLRGPRETLRIAASDPAARHPLGRGEDLSACAEAATQVRVLRVSRQILEIYGKDLGGTPPLAPDLTDLPVPPEIRDSSLFYVFCRNLQEGRLELPSLPAVAVKLRQALRDDVDFAGAARIVQMDPACAAKLVQVANSPLYRGGSRITTCQGAIARLGLLATRNLVFSLSMRNLFTVRNREIKNLAQEVWKHSVNISALASVLATRTGGVDPDKALLGGLLVRIGVIPFLSFAEKFPAGYHAVQELEQIMDILQGPVGRHMLALWGFPPDYIEIPVRAEQWHYSGGARLDLGDVVRLAVWHSYLGTPKRAELPPITELPAYAKLSDGKLTPEQSLEILHVARDQVMATYQVLSR